MDFAYSKQQELLRNVTREFCDKEIGPEASKADRERSFNYSIIEKLHKQRLLGVIIPKDFGGNGGSLIDQAIICEEIARDSFTAMVVTNFTWYLPYEVFKVGTEENKKRWIPYLFDGKKLGAHAGTEADAGTDAASIRTWAKLEGDEWVLHGAKTFVSNLRKADYFFVTVRTGEDRYGGLSTFLVEKDAPGLVYGRESEHVCVRGMSNGELCFENCRVPKENLIGRMNKGFYDMLTLYDVIRLYLVIGAVGIARAAFEASKKFAEGRRQFGKPIGDFQLVRAMIADMATEIDAARLLIYRALDMEEKGRKHTKETSMAKLFASEMADRVTYKAIQIHGGCGLTEDYPIERYWRDARVTTIGEGTSEIQRLIIAAEIFKNEKIVLDSALD